MERLIVEHVQPGINWYKAGVVFTLCASVAGLSGAGVYSMLNMSTAVKSAAEAYAHKAEAAAVADEQSVNAMKAATAALTTASNKLAETPITITNRVVVPTQSDEKRGTPDDDVMVTDTNYPTGTKTEFAASSTRHRYFVNQAKQRRKR